MKYTRLILEKFKDPRKCISVLQLEKYTHKQKFYSQNIRHDFKDNDGSTDSCHINPNQWQYKWYSSTFSTKLFAGLATAAALFKLNSTLCEPSNEEENTPLDSDDELTNCTTIPDFKPLPSKHNAINYARNLLSAKMVESGSPGLVVAVTVNGKTVYSEGYGYADVENSVPCNPRTVLRIASISKSITMAAIAKLWEEGKLDLDAPVQKYVPYFPSKTYDGKEVTITTRQLCSHMSGIRHYKIKDPNKKQEKLESKADTETKKDDDSQGNIKENDKAVLERQTANVDPIECQDKEQSIKDFIDNSNEGKDKIILITETENKKDIVDNEMDEKSLEDDSNNEKDHPTKKERKNLRRLLNRNGFRVTHGKKKKEPQEEDEFDLKEYYIKEHFETIEEALKIFQNDELFFEPGHGYKYTTYGWTLLSAVVEGAAEKSFTKVITKLFHDLGLENTYLDKNDPIIYKRGKNYIRDKKSCKMINAPYVDNSYKWAGGGFLSTVGDLTKFGNAMLYASQFKESEENDPKCPPGYLKSSTMEKVWSPVTGSKMDWDQDGNYGLGWGVVPEQYKYGCGRKIRHYVSHTGGAVGASSVLLVMPMDVQVCSEGSQSESLPQGVVVAIIANMGSVGLNKVALDIAKLFETAHKDKQNKNTLKYKTYDI